MKFGPLPQIRNPEFDLMSFGEIDKIRDKVASGKLGLLIKETELFLYLNQMKKKYRLCLKVVQNFYFIGFPLSLVFIFINWKISPILFILSIIVQSCNRKLAKKFIFNQCIADRVFLKFALAVELVKLEERNKGKPNISRANHEQTVMLAPGDAERITQEYGRFLAERQPIIKDAGLLPYSKTVIMKALVMQEQFACDKANMLAASGRSDELQEIERYIGTLGFTRMALCSYSDIDPEDKEAVSYFNSFRTIRDVPEDRKVECLKLFNKYMERGMESEIPGRKNMGKSPRKEKQG